MSENKLVKILKLTNDEAINYFGGCGEVLEIIEKMSNISLDVYMFIDEDDNVKIGWMLQDDKEGK